MLPMLHRRPSFCRVRLPRWNGRPQSWNGRLQSCSVRLRSWNVRLLSWSVRLFCRRRGAGVLSRSAHEALRCDRKRASERPLLPSRCATSARFRRSNEGFDDALTAHQRQVRRQPHFPEYPKEKEPPSRRRFLFIAMNSYRAQRLATALSVRERRRSSATARAAPLPSAPVGRGHLRSIQSSSAPAT